MALPILLLARAIIPRERDRHDQVHQEFPPQDCRLLQGRDGCPALQLLAGVIPGQTAGALRDTRGRPLYL